ncbi:tetrapyrrole biosynthesis, uroporphyrinogen III synthase [Xylariaceae sp. FL0016]|nr:tetrapyrrole biosynthesis, uroporphyrinogen III synthase [Xylariaceae sp. FL0016]
MASTLSSTAGSQIVPVLLLKTKSTPVDAYDDLFAAPRDGLHFKPTFVPVLQHRFEQDGMMNLQNLLKEKEIHDGPNNAFGGMIFTSQRAVEAFAKLVEDGKGEEQWPHLQHVPIYSVGPATSRALRAVPQVPPLQVFGEHTGNGEALAQYILEHYGAWYEDRETKPPLLFLVGEQRRDIIPKTLMDDRLPTDKRIQVVEKVVYGTGVMESFEHDFRETLQDASKQPTTWVVVFSPTGCNSMLKVLGMLDKQTGKAKSVGEQSSIHVATIGPTTRDYLKKTFDYEPDVCCEKPSPEGVWQGITSFVKVKHG